MASKSRSTRKTCKRCDQRKTLRHFPFQKDKRRSNGGYYRNYCFDCHRTKVRAANYGLTESEIERMIKSSKCQICNIRFPTPDLAQVDHDHTTGKVRGVLCRDCNIGLGLFQDDPTLLRSAIRYLRGGTKDGRK